MTNLDIEALKAKTGTSTVHELKTWPLHFQAVKSGGKPFEVRYDDRDFHVGDGLHLREFNPGTGSYSGDECFRVVSYVLPGGAFGLREGFVVMGLQDPELIAQRAELLEAVKVLRDRATAFSINGVYFDEPCFEDNIAALALVQAAISRATQSTGEADTSGDWYSGPQLEEIARKERGEV